MNICFIFSIVFISLDRLFTTASDDLMAEKQTSNIPVNDSATIQFDPDQQLSNGNFVNSFWVRHNHPNSHTTSRYEEVDVRHREALRTTPLLLTKLVKTLSYGFNPQILKELDTLEKRRKPVTLIGLKKNGIFPKQIIEHISSRSAEVAELQSPFNDVGQFWLDT